MGTQRPNLGDVSIDYSNQLEVYHDKVYKANQPLTPGELATMQKIKTEVQRKAPTEIPLTEVYISNILEMNDVILRAKEDEKLEMEYSTLGLELKVKSLTPDQRERIIFRRNEIGRGLYPEYYPT